MISYFPFKSWSVSKDGYFIFGGAYPLQNCRQRFENQKKALEARGVQFGTPVKTAASRVLRAWIASLPREEQRLFADAVYEMATAAHARTLSDWEDNWPASALAGFSALRALEPTKRKALERALGSLFSVVARSIRLPWRKDEEISE